MNSDAYELGRVMGSLMTFVVIVGLTVWFIVWVVGHNRRQAASAAASAGGPWLAPHTQTALLALGHGLVLHADPARVADLVAATLAATGRTAPVPAPSPTWVVDGGRPVLHLAATPNGALLAVREVSADGNEAHGAAVWEWLRGRVDDAAGQRGVATSAFDQRFAYARPGSAGGVWTVG